MNMQPQILAIGTAVPPYRISQEKHYAILESANGLDRREKLQMKQIYSKSGIAWRHSVLAEFDQDDRPDHLVFHPKGEKVASVADRMNIYERHAAALSVQATRNCLARLPEMPPASITHLITFSCTGMYAPGTDIELVESLGMQRNVERTCINFMGCYAAINALKTAYHISRSEPEAVILLAGVELCSLHYQKSSEANQMIANALFSDGAASAIVSAKQLSSAPITLQPVCFYSEFDPSGMQEMIWRIGNAGFDLRLTPEVPGAIRSHIRTLTDRLLHKAGLRDDQIDHYAIHPGGIKILEACELALGMTKDDNSISYEVLRDFGNMSSVTVLFVLERFLLRFSGPNIGQHIMTCAFGPGLSIESAIIKINGNGSKPW